jgi:hypothetical protein
MNETWQYAWDVKTRQGMVIGDKLHTGATT